MKGIFFLDPGGQGLDHGLTPVARSIFGPLSHQLSQAHFSKSEFKNEISSSALLDIQMTLLCGCGVDFFIPELEHSMETPFHDLFSKKKPLKTAFLQLTYRKMSLGKCPKIDPATGVNNEPLDETKFQR